MLRVFSRGIAISALAIVAACSPDSPTAPTSSPLSVGGPKANIADLGITDATLFSQTSTFGMSSINGPGTTKVADDFVVPAGQVWTVKSVVLMGEIEQPTLPIAIYADANGHPGLAKGGNGIGSAPTATDPETCCTNVVDYLFNFGTVTLPAGTYWLAPHFALLSYVASWQRAAESGARPMVSTDGGSTWSPTGDAGYSFVLFGAVQFTQTITFDPSTPNVAKAGTSATLHVTASSDLPVALSASAAGVCTFTGTTVNFVGNGTCTITANQSGNVTYVAAPTVTHDIIVASTQAITFTSAAPAPAYVNGTYTPTATGGASGNPVVITVGPPNVCTLSAGAVKFVGVGTCTIAANQAGNDTYEAAPQVTQTVKVDYQFSGFADPVKNNGINSAKAGRTIPLVWRLTDASGAPITTLAIATITVKDLSCTIGSTVNQVEESTAGGSGLQSLGNGYYQLNWKTSSSYARSCKTLQLDLGEANGVRTANFEFTK